eukprot:scaffold247_cov172-Ochromonas_danica.AAC.2
MKTKQGRNARALTQKQRAMQSSQLHDVIMTEKGKKSQSSTSSCPAGRVNWKKEQSIRAIL